MRRARRRVLRPSAAPGVPLGRTAIVVQLISALTVVGFLLAHEGVRLPLVSHSFTVRAEFADASGLDTRNHSQVTVAGVPAGRVESVSYENGVAVATLSLDSSVEGRLRADATARIIPRSALEDLTVDIDPGRPGAPPIGGDATIPAARTSSTPGADRVLDVLDADTRAQVQVLLAQLSAGLKGRSGDLRGDIAGLQRVLDSSRKVTRMLAERRTLLARFVDDVSVLFTRLDERQAELGDAIDAGQQTLATTGARDRALAASMRQLPGALDEVDRALRSVRALAVPLAPTLSELDSFAASLPGALDALREFVPAGDTLVADVRALAGQGGTPLHELSAVLKGLGPASSGLAPVLSKALPVLRAVDRHKEGIGQLGDRFSGVFSVNDANGPVLRGLGFFEPFNPADLGFSSSGDGARRSRLDAVTALTRVCLTQNPVACLARYLVPNLPGAVVSKGAAPAEGSG